MGGWPFGKELGLVAGGGPVGGSFGAGQAWHIQQEGEGLQAQLDALRTTRQAARPAPGDRKPTAGAPELPLPQRAQLLVDALRVRAVERQLQLDSVALALSPEVGAQEAAPAGMDLTLELSGRYPDLKLWLVGLFDDFPGLLPLGMELQRAEPADSGRVQGQLRLRLLAQTPKEAQ